MCTNLLYCHIQSDIAHNQVVNVISSDPTGMSDLQSHPLILYSLNNEENIVGFLTGNFQLQGVPRNMTVGE